MLPVSWRLTSPGQVTLPSLADEESPPPEGWMLIPASSAAVEDTIANHIRRAIHNLEYEVGDQGTGVLCGGAPPPVGWWPGGPWREATSSHAVPTPVALGVRVDVERSPMRFAATPRSGPSDRPVGAYTSRPPFPFRLGET